MNIGHILSKQSKKALQLKTFFAELHTNVVRIIAELFSNRMHYGIGALDASISWYKNELHLLMLKLAKSAQTVP